MFTLPMTSNGLTFAGKDSKNTIRKTIKSGVILSVVLGMCTGFSTVNSNFRPSLNSFQYNIRCPPSMIMTSPDKIAKKEKNKQQDTSRYSNNRFNSADAAVFTETGRSVTTTVVTVGLNQKAANIRCEVAVLYFLQLT
mmetsp:Transcript_36486/g.46829  ORF Transcript_36486/g.46829 Transcript_36486/m.46829 type:complete len:138 (-) Transcript_36486:1376-1789(-)